MGVPVNSTVMKIGDVGAACAAAGGAGGCEDRVAGCTAGAAATQSLVRYSRR